MSHDWWAAPWYVWLSIGAGAGLFLSALHGIERELSRIGTYVSDIADIARRRK